MKIEDLVARCPRLCLWCRHWDPASVEGMGWCQESPPSYVTDRHAWEQPFIPAVWGCGRWAPGDNADIGGAISSRAGLRHERDRVRTARFNGVPLTTLVNTDDGMSALRGAVLEKAHEYQGVDDPIYLIDLMPGSACAVLFSHQGGA